MSEKKETAGRTLLVALVMCVVCAAVVTTTAVSLKPMQVAAQEQDRAINILQIAGIYDPAIPLEQQMERAHARVIDLETGRFVDDIDPAQVANVSRLLRDPQRSINLTSEQDIAKLNRRENYSLVYIAEKENGEIERIVLPVRGYGLWSTLWGYLALEADATTVVGLGFYQHAETPGLGGEVDNPSWRAQWPGKQIFQGDELAIHVLKGQVDPRSPQAIHQVDGLSGATLTTKGVDNLLRFWLGDLGYGKFLKNLKTGEA